MEFHEKILFFFNRLAEGHRFDKFASDFLMTNAPRAARWGADLRLSDKQKAFVNKEMDAHSKLYTPQKMEEKKQAQQAIGRI